MAISETITALRFAPLVAPAVLAGFGLAATVLLMLAAWRRARGAALRAAGFALLLLWLAGPLLVRETRRGLADIGLLVMDDSASMRIGDRAALAQAARARIVAEAAKHAGLELRTVLVPEHGDRGTRLFAAIDRARAGIPRDRYAGTIAITDGQVTDIPAAAPGGAPLNVLIPAAGEQVDRVLRVVEAPGYGLVGKSVTLRVTVEDLGRDDAGTLVPLTIRREGAPSVTRPVPVGAVQTIRVPIRRAGPIVVELSAAPLAGEVSTLNDRAVVQIEGVRDRLRVLLISGSPHRGERTWRRLLKSDPSVDLVHFTILRPPDKDDLTPLDQLSLIAFPVHELFSEKIDSFDLIILDRFADEGLLPLRYLDNIARYVRHGGALLLSVGPEFAGAGSLAATPLRAVLPAVPADIGPAAGPAPAAVAAGPFRPRVTALGARDPVTAGLPGANPPGRPDAPPTWGRWYRRVRAADVHGEVLMDTRGGAPLLVLNRVEKGRVALLLSDQIWLWSRGHDGGGPAAELLRRVAHWLMKEPDLEENALTARVRGGRLAVRRRSLDGPAAAVVRVTDPAGRTEPLALHRVAPGLAAASLPAAAPGVWRVTDGTRTAYAAAGAADPAEYADLRATATKLAPLARASGGGVHWLGAAAAPRPPELRRTAPGAAASGAGWIGLQRRGAAEVTGVALVPLLPVWLALPLILGLLLAAWRREGS